MNSAIEIYKEGLCSGCGTCVSICPKDNLSLLKGQRAYILVDNNLCSSCGLCLKVCPSLNELQQLDIISCFSGYSKSDKIRFDSSSGGIVTQFLIELLELKKISGAVVCDFDSKDPTVAKGLIVHSVEDVIKASGSKYCPTPLNEVIIKLRKMEGNFAFVGLPCHIKGVRLYEEINKELKNKILIRIGLFCGHTPSFEATDYILYNHKIKKSDVKAIQYRGNGWPGKAKIITKNKETLLPPEDYWRSGFGKYFIPKACLSCKDLFANHAEISFGDAWLKEFKKDEKGTSVLICRSDNAMKLLHTCKNIYLNKISYSKVLEAQRYIYENKVKGKNKGKRLFYSFLGRQKYLWRILFLWETNIKDILRNIKNSIIKLKIKIITSGKNIFVKIL